MRNVLTVYFSRKGQTIGPGMTIVHQDKGNTQMAAEYIQRAVGGELFELKADRVYSEDHMTLIEEAKRELNAKTRVPVKEYPRNMEQYNLIFLAYPNWWNTFPMVIATFLEHYDWTGKTIIPVCTNEGSGLGESVRDIRRICKNAVVKDGVSFTGSQVKNSEKRISQWARDTLSTVENIKM